MMMILIKECVKFNIFVIFSMTSIEALILTRDQNIKVYKPMPKICAMILWYIMPIGSLFKSIFVDAVLPCLASL